MKSPNESQWRVVQQYGKLGYGVLGLTLLTSVYGLWSLWVETPTPEKPADVVVPQSIRESFQGTPEELFKLTIAVDGKALSVAEIFKGVDWPRDLGGLKQKDVGEADGKALLSATVILENAAEVLDFVNRYGFKEVRGPLRVVRRNGRFFEVEYELRGRGGQAMQVFCGSDGRPAGGG